MSKNPLMRDKSRKYKNFVKEGVLQNVVPVARPLILCFCSAQIFLNGSQELIVLLKGRNFRIFGFNGVRRLEQEARF